MDDSATIYRARKVYRDDAALLDDGAVLCRKGRIAAVGRWSELSRGDVPVVDLGDVLLLPGLINAHTHLRLTHLQGKIAPTTDFVAWLGRIALKNKFARKSTLERSAREGVRILLEGGVTTAVDIDLEEVSASAVDDTPLRLIFAHECINLDPTAAAERAAELFDLLAQKRTEPFRREHGIAPHAPYSVCRELWEELARRLKSGRRFLTIHIAESREEIEMLAESRGRLLRWLRLLGVLPRGWRSPGCSPVEFLERTGILETAGIATHCGYASDRDADRLAHYGWTVAFCPGTHEYFGRPPWPLERFRRAGVPVCVATDSAASNTAVSMMEEMRRLARWFPQLTTAEVVEAATVIPARAIGWGDEVGRIETGCLADFSAWTPGWDGDVLGRDWFETDLLKCAATIIGGEIAWRSQNEVSS